MINQRVWQSYCQQNTIAFLIEEMKYFSDQHFIDGVLIQMEWARLITNPDVRIIESHTCGQLQQMQFESDYKIVRSFCVTVITDTLCRISQDNHIELTREIASYVLPTCHKRLSRIINYFIERFDISRPVTNRA